MKRRVCAVQMGFLVVLATLVLAGCGVGRSSPERPQAVAGVMDLSHWVFARDGLVALDGQWALEWQRFGAPEPPAVTTGPADPPGPWIKVPGPWNGATVGDTRLGRDGHGTYRLTVQCQAASGLAVSLPMQHSAARFFINGALVAQQGVPGATAQATQPSPVQQIVDLDHYACPLHIAAQVANFDHRRGGMMRSVELGTREQLHGRRELNLARDLFALGSMVIMSLLSLLFYASRGRDRSPLYFGLFGLSFALYVGLSGERILQPVVSPLGWDVYLKLAFLSLYLNITLFTLFLRAIYPREFGPRVGRAVAVFGGVSTVLVLLTPIAISSLANPLLQLASVLTAVYTVAMLVRAIRARRDGAGVLLAGLLVLIVAIVHDALRLSHLRAVALSPYGIMLFVLAPGILLGRRFARALSAEELRALEQSERANLLLRSTRAGLLDWDVVAGTLVFSERFREIVKVEPDAPLASFYDLMHPDDREMVRTRFNAQLRDRAIRSAVRPHEALEYRLMQSDGEAVWVHAEGIGLCDANGRTLRFICSFIDISQRKRQEVELSNQVKFINDLFDSVPLGLALRDADGRHLVVNRTWEKYLGVKREDIIGTSLRDIAGRAAESTLALDRQALALAPGQVSEPNDYDYRGRRYMQTRTVMVDAEGQRIGVLVASLDITDKFATEQALATERERLRLLVRSTRAGFGDWDAVNDVVTYSDRFKTMLGYPADTDTSGWPSIFERMHPDDKARAHDEFRAMIRRKAQPGEQEPGQPMSYRLRRTDGSYIWIHAEGIAQVDEQGRTLRFITSYYDVTQYRAQEEALKENVRLREEVERISRHDLKTPLNSIIAVPRLLREERHLSADEDALLGVVERAGYRILSMVNLSLDLYKMESGTYIFRPDAVDLAGLLAKVLLDLDSHAASKGVTLDVRTGDTPIYAWAEELLCYSLLANLVKNALEAAPHGSTVRMTLARGNLPQTVALQIHNEGAVPAAVRSQFFEKYATAGKASGTGLGTYSARLMARVQDGDIEMQTSEATGTMLTVRLRAAPAGTVPASTRHAAERRRAEPLPVAQLPALRVLLVDDDEYNLLIVQRFLPSPPLIVETAINGLMALDMAQARWPQVIFMDLDMPVMGGLEAVARLRALEQRHQHPRCLIVALSSHDDVATQQRCLAGGFDRYLTKPVTRDVIRNALLWHADPAQWAAAAPPAGLISGDDAGPGDMVMIDADLLPMLDGFLASRRALCADLCQALARGDREGTRSLAHQLAGSLALYGFHWAARCSRDIEAQAPAATLVDVAKLAQALQVHLAGVVTRVARRDAANG